MPGLRAGSRSGLRHLGGTTPETGSGSAAVSGVRRPPPRTRARSRPEGEHMTQTVAITGASAVSGGRSRLFASAGTASADRTWPRGLQGLCATCSAGRVALALPATWRTTPGRGGRSADRGDARPDRRVGQRGVRLGLLPFAETPEEFRRSPRLPTSASCTHHGRAARMRPRDHGVIVQVGSPSARAASRCSPPTAAASTRSTVSPSRCAASSCTTSRRPCHVVQMPAVNTPQFSW